MLLNRSFVVIGAAIFDFNGNSIFAGNNFLVDAGSAAAIVKFLVDLPAAVGIVRGALKSSLVARQYEGVASVLAAFLGPTRDSCAKCEGQGKT